MKVPALRIEINGELMAEAGAEDLSLLTGQVGLGVGPSGALDVGPLMFSAMGLAVAGPTPRQFTWGHGMELTPGDRVTFQVIETDTPSPPSKVRGTPSAAQFASPAASAERSSRGESWCRPTHPAGAGLLSCVIQSSGVV